MPNRSNKFKCLCKSIKVINDKQIAIQLPDHTASEAANGKNDDFSNE